MLNDDYQALIRYKQLSMAEKPPILSTLAPRKQQWEICYQAMNHPSEPIPPASYISVVPNVHEDDDDVVGLSVITRNLDILASVPMTPFYLETVDAVMIWLLLIY